MENDSGSDQDEEEILEARTSRGKRTRSGSIQSRSSNRYLTKKKSSYGGPSKNLTYFLIG